MHSRDVVVTDAASMASEVPSHVAQYNAQHRQRMYSHRRSGLDSLSSSSCDDADRGGEDGNVQMTTLQSRITAAATTPDASPQDNSFATAVVVDAPPLYNRVEVEHASTTRAALVDAAGSTSSLNDAMYNASVASDRAQRRCAEAAALVAAAAVQLHVGSGGMYDVIATATTHAMAQADNYEVSVSDACHPNTFTSAGALLSIQQQQQGLTTRMQHSRCTRYAYQCVRSLKLQIMMSVLYVVVVCVTAFAHVLCRRSEAAWLPLVAALMYAAEHVVLLVYMGAARFAHRNWGTCVMEGVVMSSLVILEVASWQLSRAGYMLRESTTAGSAATRAALAPAPAAAASTRQQQQLLWLLYIFGKMAVLRLLLWCLHAVTRLEQLMLALRCCCSGDRRRYQAEGADLDLCYVHRNLIAMAWPASGVECAFRNPVSEVAALLDRKHARAYVVVNLCSERTYRPTPFHEQTWWYAMDDHNPCELTMMLRFCREACAFILADVDARVVAVHCKGGKGRTGTMLCALMLYIGLQDTAEGALDHFAKLRTVAGVGDARRSFQGVQTPSQGRYVRYFARLLGLPTHRITATHDGHDADGTSTNDDDSLAVGSSGNVGGSAVRGSKTRRLTTVVPSQRLRVQALRLCCVPWLWYAHGIGKLWFAIVQKPCSERHVTFVSNAAVRFDGQLPDAEAYTAKQLRDLFASDEDNLYRECNTVDAHELQDGDDNVNSHSAATTVAPKRPLANGRQGYACDTESFWYYVDEEGPARMDYVAFAACLRRRCSSYNNSDNSRGEAMVVSPPRTRAADVPHMHVTLELKMPERLPVLEGDVVFKFYFARNNPSTLEAPVQFWFHTGFERAGKLRLPRDELDGPAKDAKGERYPAEFAIHIDLADAAAEVPGSETGDGGNTDDLSSDAISETKNVCRQQPIHEYDFVQDTSSAATHTADAACCSAGCQLNITQLAKHRVMMMHRVDAPGADGVKAAYHCATLLHNWEEERKTFANAVPAATMAATASVATASAVTQTQGRCGGSVTGTFGKPPTTYTTSYTPYSANEVATAKPPSCFCDEAPRALLLYHGDIAAPVTYQRTLQEMCYVTPAQQSYTHDETLDLPGVSSRQRRTRALAHSLGLSTATDTASTHGGSGNDAATTSANMSLVEKEATLLRSMRDVGGSKTNSTRRVSSETMYTPPVLPPIGRVMQRDCQLTTKQVTIDATSEYVRTHLHVYPRTSSVCIGPHMASMNNVMHKTRLRQDDYADCL